MLGRCKVGRPPGNISGQGVENVLSASDKELENWLAANEETSDVGNKLCDHSAKLTNLVMNFSESGTHILSNYTLFEWKPDSSRSPSYLYLRGKIQRITKYSEYFGADLFKIKEIKDVWLIATNRPINFSAARSSDEWNDKLKPFNNENEENCKTGIILLYWVISNYAQYSTVEYTEYSTNTISVMRYSILRRTPSRNGRRWKCAVREQS